MKGTSMEDRTPHGQEPPCDITDPFEDGVKPPPVGVTDPFEDGVKPPVGVTDPFEDGTKPRPHGE
jgi:hypothetical protein